MTDGLLQLAINIIATTMLGFKIASAPLTSVYCTPYVYCKQYNSKSSNQTQMVSAPLTSVSHISKPYVYVDNVTVDNGRSHVTRPKLFQHPSVSIMSIVDNVTVEVK